MRYDTLCSGCRCPASACECPMDEDGHLPPDICECSACHDEEEEAFHCCKACGGWLP